MKLHKHDQVMLDAMERLALSSEFSTVLGILQKTRGNKLSRETLTEIVTNLSEWPEETAKRIIDDLEALGWIEIAKIEIVRLLPQEERRKH